MNRRSFLHAAAAGCIAQVIPPSVMGQQADFWSQPRSIWLYRPATRETVKATYFADGRIIESEYNRLCVLLRDVRANQAVQMSPVLLDILAGVQGWLSAHGIVTPLHTNSGYRNPQTNGAIEGSARNSLHMQGMAWDGRVPNVSTESLAKFAQYIRGGGVGFYESREFVHIDAGKLRSWRG